MTRSSMLVGLMAAGLALAADAAAPLALAGSDSLAGTYLHWRHGESQAMDGGLLAVGVPFASQSNGGTQFQRNGVVGIYRWIGGRWLAVSWLDLARLGYTLQDDARFGAALAVSGNRVLIGCPGCTGARPKAFLVEAPPHTLPPDPPPPLVWWPVQPSGITSPSDPDNGIGSAVAIAGSVVAVGAPRATFGLLEFGAVAVGRFDGSQIDWEETFFGWESSRFGQALALEQTHLANPLFVNHHLLVGAPQYVQSGVLGLAGRARLFHRASVGAWTPGQELANPDPGFGDGLGSAVAIHWPSVDASAFLALGAPGRRLDGGPAAGTVRVYSRTGVGGTYVLDTEVQHAAPAVADRFGGALALHGGRLLVGADGRAVDLLADAGSAFLFDRRFNVPSLSFEWLHRQTLTPRGGGNGNFGSSLALGPRAASVGMPRYDPPGGSVDAGTVETYLCDQIFAHDLESDAAFACAGP